MMNESNYGGRGGVAGSQPMSPNKLWRSNSIINLYYKVNRCSAKFLLPGASKNAHPARVSAADPRQPGQDPSFLFYTDPDQAYHFGAADPNLAPQSDANLRQLVYRPSMAIV
jgi:hypothetical protein